MSMSQSFLDIPVVFSPDPLAQKKLNTLSGRIAKGEALSRDDIMFFIQHTSPPFIPFCKFTVIGFDMNIKKPFVEKIDATDPVEAIVIAEKKHHESSVHIVFQGQLGPLIYSGE